MGSGQGYAHAMSLALPRWLRHPSERTKDVAITVLLAVPVVGTTIGAAIHHHEPWMVVFGVAVVLPLLWRRTRPLAALAAILAVGIAIRPEVFLAPAVVVLYRIASTRPGRTITVSVGAVLAAVVVHRLVWASNLMVGHVIGPATVCGAAVALGLAAANRRAKMDTLRERAERLDRERELLADQAVSDERVRIARELHDTIGHSVSLMIVQAQALGATVAEPPVVEATDGIANLGRDVMAEINRTLRLLRTEEDDRVDRAPRPGLDSLDPLLEQSRAAGIAVDLAIEGAPRPLSPSLDLSAFRIVQEALTNVRKHAGDAPTVVRVRYVPDGLRLAVENDGPALPAAVRESGHGLVGMRERVSLYGGDVEAGPRPEGGFVVRIHLPIAPGAA